MREAIPQEGVSQLDRLLELTNIGAGHAATALAELVGRTFWMDVPQASLAPRPGEGPLSRLGAEAGWRTLTGVFFEIHGALSGTVALLLPPRSRASLLAHLLGRPCDETCPVEAEAALQEVGNIVVSHVVSAMAETLGEAILPSLPALAARDAGFVLAALIALRGEDRPTLRIESEIADSERELRAVLVFLPDLGGDLPG